MDPEYLEARILVPKSKVEEFLAFCQRVIGDMPAVHRVHTNGHGPEVIQQIEAAASKKKRRIRGR